MPLPEDNILTRHFVADWVNRVANAARRVGITPRGTISITDGESGLSFLVLNRGDLVYKDLDKRLKVLKAPTDPSKYLLGVNGVIPDAVPVWVPITTAQNEAQRQHIIGTSTRFVF